MTERKDVVLFVDDEEHILSSIRRYTQDESFEALFAGSGQKALDILAQTKVSVIVTDMRMPGMDGLTLLKMIKEKYPQTVRIVLSGYTQLSQVLATVNQADIFQFIPKPWKMEEELLVGVRQGIKQYNLIVERDVLQERLAQKNQAYQNILYEMEQKFANGKKDLANVGKLQRWIFALWRKNPTPPPVENSKAGADDYIDSLETIFGRYLEILPTQANTKLLENTLSEISKVCAGQIVMQPVRKTNINFTGYHAFVIMVFKTLLEALPASADEKLICRVNSDKDTGSPGLIVFSLQMRETIKAAFLIKIICAFLNEMGKTYNVWLKQELIDGEIGAIQIIWQSTAESASQNNLKAFETGEAGINASTSTDK